ncbi:ATP-binding cassette domain-containing protein [Candidatus Bathyarchaeota archaeon]|nr:ATP-binding cassette domain-containing protein [Candidatus Bathyarchaeota archaeon]
MMSAAHDNHDSVMLDPRQDKLGGRLKVTNFSFKYNKESKPILQDLTFTLHPGEISLLAGPSGCGKTTLAYCISGLVPRAFKGYWKGSILYEDGEQVVDPFSARVSDFSTITSFVSQNPDDILVSLDVRAELAFGLENLGMPVPEIKEKIDQAVTRLGISHLLDKEVHQLSTGQKQLVGIASYVLMDCPFIILDEPTAYLDPMHLQDLLAFLERIKSSRAHSIVILDHDVDSLYPVIDRFMHMSREGTIDYRWERGTSTKRIRMDDIKATFTRSASEISWLFSLTGFLENLDRETYCTDELLAKMREIQATTAGKLPSLQFARNERDILEKSPSVREWYGSAIDPNRGGKTVHEADSPLLRLENVSYSYPGSPSEVLSDASISIREGESVGIMGMNGAGKSTLLKLVAGMIQPTKGQIFYKDTPIGTIRRKKYYRDLGFTFQNPEMQLFNRTVKRELLYSIQNYKVEIPMEETMQEMVGMIGIEHQDLDTNPFLLSWGQKRRLSILSSIIHQPPLLILDEPFLGHDAATSRSVMELLCQLHDDGKTILMASHDVNMLAKSCTRMVYLNDGSFTDITPDTGLPEGFNTHQTHVMSAFFKKGGSITCG